MRVIIKLAVIFPLLFLWILLINPDSAFPDSLGDRVTFKTINYFTQDYDNTDAICKKVGDHCYIYLADTVSMSNQLIENTKNEFDNHIYPTCRYYFGIEPDIDGDPRITILIYDIKSSVVAGYFNRKDQGGNNKRDMIYIDQDLSISSDCYGCIAHEFQHLIHYNMDPTEEIWVNEGFSCYASYICGYGEHNNSKIYAFLENPDNSLIDFYDAEDHFADFGAAYLFIYYLVQEYGEDERNFIKNIVRDKADSITGIENHLPGNITFVDVFKNWIIANYLDSSSMDSKYQYKDLDIHVEESWNQLYVPDEYILSIDEPSPVSNWAADYVRIVLKETGFKLNSIFEGDGTSQFSNSLIYDNQILEFDLIDPPNRIGNLEIETNSRMREVVYIISRAEMDPDGDGEYQIALQSGISSLLPPHLGSEDELFLSEKTGCFIGMAGFQPSLF